MRTHNARRLSRREFLGGLSLVGTAGCLGVHPRLVAAEPPPETTRLRLARVPGICVAPEYVAEELLQGEGFTEVHYVEKEGSASKQTALASGEVDLTLQFSGPLLLHMDTGDLVVILAGVHVGCWELFDPRQTNVQNSRLDIKTCKNS